MLCIALQAPDTSLPAPEDVLPPSGGFTEDKEKRFRLFTPEDPRHALEIQRLLKRAEIPIGIVEWPRKE